MKKPPVSGGFFCLRFFVRPPRRLSILMQIK